MRWSEVILLEAVKKYEPMFAGLYPNGRIPPQVLEKIGEIEKTMGREDRIIWMLRWYRFLLVSRIVATAKRDETTIKPEKYSRDISDTKLSHDLLLNSAEDALKMLPEFKHFFSLKLPAIDKIIFKKQLPSEIDSELRAIEDEWKENRRRGIQHDLGTTMVLDFHNGWAWFDLQRPHCREEGSAMGHCGNTAASRSGDTILSLRQKIADNEWAPHLTFILHDNGYLGEMKGRGNEKPVERYHKYITALLKLDIIRGIAGGGYMPENNFSLYDLPKAEAEELKKLKPELMNLYDVLKTGNKKLIEAKALDVLHANDWNYEKIEDDCVIIRSWSGIESFALDNMYDLDSAFDQIESQLDEIENGEEIYDKFRSEYFSLLVKEHCYDFCFYICDQVYVDFTNTRVNLCISIKGLASVEAHDDDGIGSIDQLDDQIDEHRSFSEMNFQDDIDEAVMRVACQTGHARASNAGKYLKDAVNIIKKHYEDSDLAGGSPTVHDPRQMKFDF